MASTDRDLEPEETRRDVAKKFAEGSISFDDMVQILGYDEAKIVANYVRVTEKSFKEGLS